MTRTFNVGAGKEVAGSEFEDSLVYLVDFRPRQSYIVRYCLKITNKLNKQINQVGEMAQRRTWVPSSQWLPTTICNHNSRGSDPLF